MLDLNNCSISQLIDYCEMKNLEAVIEDGGVKKLIEKEC